MGSRDAEHEQWNLDHGLKPGAHLSLVCPRCARPHTETLTSNPDEPDYLHHVHQCTHCGLRFELFVRCRSTGSVDPPTYLIQAGALETLAACVKDGVLQMRDVDRAEVYKSHLGDKMRGPG